VETQSVGEDLLVDCYVTLDRFN